MSIADSLRYNLGREGYDVQAAFNGETAIRMFEAGAPDLVILDLILPDISGLDVLYRIRTISDTPVLIITVKDSEADKVTGIELGANVYITKPFSMREVVAYVRALLRAPRDSARGTPVLTSGPLVVNPESREVQLRGEPLVVPAKEFELLRLLLARPGQAVSRATLLAEIWGVVEDTSHTLDTHIGRLRRRVEDDPTHPRIVLTVRGFGYRIAADQ